MGLYRYTLTSRLGSREVTPINTAVLQKTWEQENNRAEYTVKLAGDMLFGGSDFGWLLTLEKLEYRCEYITLLVEKKCQGNYNYFASGTLSLNQGKWDLERCTVSLETGESEKYLCWENNKDLELNAINLVNTRISVTPYVGAVAYQEFDGESVIPEPPISELFPGTVHPEALGWTMLEFSSSKFGEVYQWFVKWARVVYDGIGVPTGDWIYDAAANKYVTFPIVFNQSRSELNEVITYTSSIFDTQINHGIPFNELIQAVLVMACPNLTLRSDFFQINPIEVTAINYVTGKKSKVTNLVIFQKSDVKRPNAASNATIYKITPAKFFEDICNMFQLEWKITDDNFFVLEHVSKRFRVAGLNTTTWDYNKGRRRYSYDNDKLPIRENFNFMETSYGDFAGLPIVYSGACVGKGSKKDESISVEKITTDVIFCISNPNKDSKVSDDGGVLIATDGEGRILNEKTILGGNFINNTLAWAQLQRDYWRHNRSLKSFQMNGVLTQALTVKPTKIEEEIRVKIPCGSVFDPEKLIKTHLGSNGILSDAKYDLYKELLTLSVLFPAEDGLIQNTAPKAVNDLVETFETLPVICDVMANDTSEGGIVRSTIEILGGPTFGTAIILPDFNIQYTPNVGFVGTDAILYRFKDQLFEPSNGAVFSITVKAGTPTPTANTDNYNTFNSGIFAVNSANGLLANDVGPSALTVIPETKATTGGGTVQIYSNGSFEYTPLPGFVGLDQFQYTIKDLALETDTGQVNITVLEALPLWVSLHKGKPINEPISEYCNGVYQKLGDQTVVKVTLKFWADAAKTTPLNVNGYNLKVNIKNKFVNPTTGVVIDEYTDIASIPDGIEFIYNESFKLYYTFANCDGSFIERNGELTLLPGTGYNI